MAGKSIVSKTLGGAGFLFGNVVSPIMTYSDSRKQGGGVGTSLAKAAASELFYATPIGRAVGLAQLGMAGAQIGLEVGRDNAKHSSKFYKGQFGGNYNLSENGYTMRQRGQNAIQRSGMNARNALGSEARTFHRGYYGG